MWPEALRLALLELFGSESAEDGSYRVKLLRDIWSIFHERQLDRIASAELCSALCDMEAQPWRDWNKGKGMNASALAKQVRDFHVYSNGIRIRGKTAKGYMKADFEDAWSRYCPQTVASCRNAVTTRTNIDDLHDLEESQPSERYGSKRDENPRQSSTVTPLRLDTPIVRSQGSEETFEIGRI